MKKYLSHDGQLPLCFDAPDSDALGVLNKDASKISNVVSIELGHLVRITRQEEDAKLKESVILDTVLARARNLGW